MVEFKIYSVISNNNLVDKYLTNIYLGESEMQIGQTNKNKGSNSTQPNKDGKYANCHVQQGIRERKMNSSNTIELTITEIFISSIYVIVFLYYFVFNLLTTSS